MRFTFCICSSAYMWDAAFFFNPHICENILICGPFYFQKAYCNGPYFPIFVVTQNVNHCMSHYQNLCKDDVSIEHKIGKDTIKNKGPHRNVFGISLFGIEYLKQVLQEGDGRRQWWSAVPNHTSDLSHLQELGSGELIKC